jgi:hypothetical protein
MTVKAPEDIIDDNPKWQQSQMTTSDGYQMRI